MKKIMKKVVMITGCSSGFGKALCNEFSKQGYFVIATARKLEALLEVQADLKVTLDVSNKNSVEKAIEYIQSRVERIDILVNNAGYSMRCAIEEIYKRDLRFRGKQLKSDVYSCARRLVYIDKSRRLKMRYTLGVSLIYRIFVRMPARLKEWGIRRFN